MDQLSPFFDHFSSSANVFFTGNLCVTSEFDTSEGLGHLHVLRTGSLEITMPNGEVTLLDQPCLLLHPRPVAHRLRPVDGSDTDLVCALIDLGNGLNNPLITALPDMLQVKLVDIPRLAPVLDLLFDESSHAGNGQRAALDRLLEYLLILLLRHVIDSGYTSAGILAGLGDPRLHKAIKAMHDQPGYQWTLEELAQLATMSRARFAARFKEKTGTTPLNHLTQWRIAVACSMLRKGARIERIAHKVGYNSQSAFTRVFTRQTGMPPLEWLHSHNRDNKSAADEALDAAVYPG